MRRGWMVAALPVFACSNGGPSAGPGPATFDTSQTSVASEHGTDGSSADTSDPETGEPDTSGATTDAESESSTGEATPPDYAAGTWSFENVSGTPTMGLHGRRARLDTGQEAVAWSEVDPDDLSILNILTAVQDGGDWTYAALTNFQEQNTYPTMVGAGETAFLAWTGRMTDAEDYDLWVTEWNGAIWSAPRNLTNALDDPLEPQDDSRPVMVRRPGSLVVAYTVTESVGPMTGEVYVSEFLPDDDPSTRELLIPESAGSCIGLTGASSADGVAHFIGHCGGDLIHATDRSGEWDWDTLGGIGTGVLSPSASAGLDGDVHLVWVQSDACGTETCEDVYYAKTTDGVFGAPVNVTNSPNLSERMPTVAIDPWGRVLVFCQVRLDDVQHLRLSVSDDGVTFGESMRITPDGTDDGYQTPADVAFDDDGLPSFAFEYVFHGTDPLNIDIHLARFAR